MVKQVYPVYNTEVDEGFAPSTPVIPADIAGDGFIATAGRRFAAGIVGVVAPKTARSAGTTRDYAKLCHTLSRARIRL